MALTNAQRQAKHRAKHVKLSTELANSLHCTLIFARSAAEKAGDHLLVVRTHEDESALYTAQGMTEMANTSAAMAQYAWARCFEADGLTDRAERYRARARELAA